MKTEEEIKLLKIVWAFMLEHGKITDGGWSHYGGGFELPPAPEKRTISYWTYWEKEKQKLIQAVASFGVDWESTEVPEYQQHNEFVGTESPSQECDSFLGTIYLKNNIKYMLGTSEVSELAMKAHNALSSKKAMEEDNLVAKYFGG